MDFSEVQVKILGNIIGKHKLSDLIVKFINDIFSSSFEDYDLDEWTMIQIT